MSLSPIRQIEILKYRRDATARAGSLALTCAFGALEQLECCNFVLSTVHVSTLLYVKLAPFYSFYPIYYGYTAISIKIQVEF